MNYLRYCLFMPLLLFAAETYGEDAFLVSNGILAVDASALTGIGIDIVDEDGQAMKGVIAFRTGLSVTDKKWTPLIGQRGSDSKVESGNIIMLPVRAVQCPRKPHSVSGHSGWSEAARDYNN